MNYKSEWQKLKEEVLNSDKKEFTVKKEVLVKFLDNMINVEKALTNFKTNVR